MKHFTLPLALSLATTVTAQIAPSDSLFNTDQVAIVYLTFADDDFWDQLTTNYDDDLGETLSGDITITDQTGTYTLQNIEVDLKGNSSYSHPGNKKSFKVDFNDNITGQKYHGMTKLHFNNCWGDPTFMREKIFFDHCQEVGVLAPRVQYANVYMNGALWGFYNMVEAVDKDFLDRHVDDNNGNLFKAGDNFGMGGPGGGGAEADLKWYGTDAASYSTRYELKTNGTENDWSDLIELLDLLNNGTNEELATQLPATFEWDPLLRSLALDNIFGNLDAYIQSARNYYLYHDSTTLLWNWIHWDANMAFGSYPAMGQNALTLSPMYVANNRPLMTKLMTIPTLQSAYLNAYCAVLENFTNDHLDPRIDAVAAMIQPHVVADPHKQYTIAQFNTNISSDVTVTGGGPGGSQTLRGLKSFIGQRSANLSGLLDCTTVGLAENDIGMNFSVSPNPTKDRIVVALPNGRSLKSLALHDATGRSIAITYSGNEVDLSTVPSGLYVLSADVDGVLLRKHVVKE